MALGPALWAGTNISKSPNSSSWAPRAAVDSSGNIYVVWVEVYREGNGDLFFSLYNKAAGLWTTPQNISNSGRVWSETLEVSGIAVDAANHVHVVWTEQSAVRMRTFMGVDWWGVESIAGGGTLEGAKIAASGNDLYLVWWSNDGTVHSRARIGGAWESARMLSEGGRRSKFPDIAAGNGYVMATWVEKSGDLYQAAYALRGRGYGAGWSAPARVAPQSHSQQHPAVEFLFGELPQIIFTPVYDPNRRVVHCAWTGSGFGSPLSISDETMLHYPSMAERGGLLLAVWQVGGYGDGQAVYYNAFANGKWGGPSAVPASNGSTFCDVALDPQGKPVFVWDAFGEIMADLNVGVASIPNVAPTAEFSFSPPTGIAPLEVTFDASASHDPDGQIVQYDWMFGDGETGSGRTVNHVFRTRGMFAVKLTVIDNLGKTGSQVRPIEVLGLSPPLQVSWESFTDESLFMSRTVTDVTWKANPANDEVAAIVIYRVFRRQNDADDPLFRFCGEVDGATFLWRDLKVPAPGRYSYAVTALDAEGHESPMSGLGMPTAETMDAAARARIRVLSPARLPRR